jgi:thiamine-phosphate pyrophosphorylase
MEPAFKLILISPERSVENEQALLRELFEVGLQLYHLRKPGAGLSEMRNYLTSIPKEFHNRTVLHTYFELTGEFEVKGIHLNEENKSIYAQFENQKIISASFHSLEKIKENTLPYEYVFLSPIFDSISKEGYKSKFDLKSLQEELSSLRSQKQTTKIIALGGIDAKNILRVQQAGFSGAALLGAVWQSENPVQSFSEIKSLVRADG